MKSLYESLLDPDDLDVRVLQAAELDSILEKYVWNVKSARFDGDVLRIIGKDRLVINKFDELAKELHCRKFFMFPQVQLMADELDGLELEVETNLQIYCENIKNCVLTAGAALTIQGKPTNKVKMINNTVHAQLMKFLYLNGAVMAGNDFDDVTLLSLEEYGKKIDDRVMSMNLVSKRNGRYSYCPRPEKDVDPKLDPLKWMGLDRHFKNIKQITFALAKDRESDYLCFYRSHPYKQWDWGIQRVEDLDSGWQAVIKQDARGV